MGTLVTYIREARDRPNVTIRADALVDRVRLSGDRATGIRYIDAAGQPREVEADLIVLAAGAYGSPAVLQRSGIGPAAALRDRGIEPVLDLPVGRHLLEHTECGIRIQGEGLGELHGYPWCVNVRGAADGRGEPEWHVACTPMDEVEDVAAVYAMLCRQDSEGSLMVANADPSSPPVIDHRYLSEQSDLGRFERAFAFLRELITQPCFAERGTRELSAGASVREILATGHVSAHHQAGTCRMGPADDPGSVVDNQLRVLGTEGLMVADASIFPDNIMFNTNLTCYMIGEAAAARISADATTVRLSEEVGSSAAASPAV
jgi:choline dehydrogenase